MPANESTSSRSSQLVGEIPTLPETQEGATEQDTPRVNAARPRRRQVKAKPAPGGRGGSPPSSPEQPGGADSDNHSKASESGEGRWHRRRQRAERRLAPARLNLPDVTYEIWRFDVQGWLDQYDEASMHPHIFGSLQGYPGNMGSLLTRRNEHRFE